MLILQVSGMKYARIAIKFIVLNEFLAQHLILRGLAFTHE
jgi:hypothetical protein